jgi:hypothetical protein
MDKPRFNAEFEGFYNTCLAELKARPNYTEAWIPQLERFVTITAKLVELNAEIVDTEVEVDHTNKAGKTNKVTSPAWRMFIALDSQANALADKLKLSPHTAPAGTKKPEKKGFDLAPMTVKKTG